MLDIIRADLKTLYPSVLCDAFIDSYINIKEQYYLMKHEPAELNGGKFVEACVRIIQQELTGTFVPIGTHIPNMVETLRAFEKTDSTKNDSFRLHIPRALLSIYNIRNRRGVGHLGGDVNPNLADSTLIVTTADWILAEFYRIIYSISLKEAQNIVNDLVKRKLLLIHQMEQTKRVLDPTLSYNDQTLLLLASVHPKPMSDKDLTSYIECPNPSQYRSYNLKRLHKQRMIEYSSGNCYLLPPGLKYIETNYGRWILALNKGA